MKMETEVERYLHLPYRIELEPDSYADGRPCYMARHPELPGCTSHGDTPNEAVASLADARKLYLASLLRRGLPVPLPDRILEEGAATEEVLAASRSIEG